MRFLVDAQLPPALAHWIADQGHVAEHVAIALAPTEPDAAIVRYSIENGAVIITKDSDFLTLAPPPPYLLLPPAISQIRHYSRCLVTSLTERSKSLQTANP